MPGVKNETWPELHGKLLALSGWEMLGPALFRREEPCYMTIVLCETWAKFYLLQMELMVMADLSMDALLPKSNLVSHEFHWVTYRSMVAVYGWWVRLLAGVWLVGYLQEQMHKSTKVWIKTWKLEACCTLHSLQAAHWVECFRQLSWSEPLLRRLAHFDSISLKSSPFT